jgi:hypothetical protein
MMVRLFDADVRQLADVQREAEIDDCGLEIHRQAAIGRQRVDLDVAGRAEVGLEGFDLQRACRLGLQGLRQFELEICLDVVEAEDVDRVRRPRRDFDVRHRVLLSRTPQ